MSWLSSLVPVVGTGLGALLGGPAGALIGGMAGSGVSSAMSASEAVNAQRSMNEANIASAKDTNATSIELANTAHQREVADLKAAGLNPILSSKYGGSATPSLTVPQGESLAPTILNSAKQSQDVFSSNAGLSMQAMQQKAAISLTSAQALKTGLEAKQVAMKNHVIAKEVANKKYEEDRRLKRPRWQKNLGIDVQDSVGSVLGPVIKLFK